MAGHGLAARAARAPTPPEPVLCGPTRTARSSRATGCDRCGAVIYHDPHRRDARPLLCLPCWAGVPGLAS